MDLLALSCPNPEIIPFPKYGLCFFKCPIYFVFVLLNDSFHDSAQYYVAQICQRLFLLMGQAVEDEWMDIPESKKPPQHTHIQ